MLITILAVIFGLAMGLAFTFYGLRVFLVMIPVWGFFAGYWLGALGVSLILGEGFLASSTSFLVGMATAVAVALLWVLHRYSYDRYLVIVITSLGGASLLVAAALILVGRIQVNEVVTSGNALSPILNDSSLWMVAWLLLAAVGIFAQIRAHRGFDFTKHDLVQGWS